MSLNRHIANLGGQSLATDAEATAAASAAAAAVPTGAKNLLYNGAMQVAQRGTSTAGITTSGYYTADRWQFNIASLGTWTQSLETDAPTGSGFSKSWKVLCTTAQTSPSASSVFSVRQRLEGQDVQRVRKGSSSAESLTLSFWVKSNVTGTYVVELYDLDNTRQVSASYSVAASGTWERKTVTFPADTTGAFGNDNNGSLQVSFYLATGSNLSSGTLNTSWDTVTSANRAVGQTNLAAATNNYWQVTGVQLEVGDTTTEFEHLPFGVELARCQRYYEKSYEYADKPGSITGTAGTSVSFPSTYATWFSPCFAVRKRALPNVTTYAPHSGSVSNMSVNMNTNVALGGIPARGESGFNTYASYTANVSAYIHWTADAEL